MAALSRPERPQPLSAVRRIPIGLPRSIISTPSPAFAGPRPAFKAAGGLPPTPRVAVTPPLAGSVSASGFAGISQCSYPDTCVEPPDPWVAAGPSDIVQAVNEEIRVSSRSGATRATVAFPSFFAEPGGQVSQFDPRVLWDATHGRWIATATSFDCTAGHLYVAISGATDPAGAWTVYSLDFPGTVPDYPDPGVSSDKVVISANQFPIVPSGGSCDLSTTSYSGATLDIIDWSDLLSGSALDYSETLPNATLFTWRPATALSTTSTLPAVVVVRNGGNWDVGYATISGTNAAGTVAVSGVGNLTTAGVVAGFLQPPVPAGAAAFAFARTVDGRPTDALWQNGHLWFVSTYPCVPSGDTGKHDCVRATALDTSTATPTLSQDFLAGHAGYDFFMGGIGLAADTTRFLVFSVSSSTTAISTYATAQLPGDPVNTYRPLTLVKAGLATYGGSGWGQRWGDYVGVAQDPVDAHAVWQGDAYPDAGGAWATWISQLTDLSGATFVPLTPARLLDTRFANGLAGKFSAGTPRTFQVTGRDGVPANATAVTGNLTVTNATSAGYVFLGPDPISSPSSSTLNFPLGDSRANGVTVALGVGGTLSATLAPSGTTDLIFDVTGYFVS